MVLLVPLLQHLPLDITCIGGEFPLGYSRFIF